MRGSADDAIEEKGEKLGVAFLRLEKNVERGTGRRSRGGGFPSRGVVYKKSYDQSSPSSGSTIDLTKT